MSNGSDFIGLGAITGYTQTATLTSSQTVAVPPGTKRIDALLCGGGGPGGNVTNGGGGFGGLQIYEIPVIGSSLSLIVGAGGTVISTRGGTTSVSINGAIQAAVGGGGGGDSLGSQSTPSYMNGLFGGGGGGGGSGSAGNGGAPFSVKNLLWSAMDVAPRTGNSPGTAWSQSTGSYPSTFGTYQGPGSGGISGSSVSFGANKGVDGCLGYGGGGSKGGVTAGMSTGGAGGGGGQGGGVNNAGGAGGGGGGGDGTNLGSPGGSLATISIWGLTGFAGGTAPTGSPSYSGGGGGGMLGAGGNGVTTTGGAGGNGGGGGGGGANVGAGGNGFAIFRFYK